MYIDIHTYIYIYIYIYLCIQESTLAQALSVSYKKKMQNMTKHSFMVIPVRDNSSGLL
jgi:hypothetical protein